MKTLVCGVSQSRGLTKPPSEVDVILYLLFYWDIPSRNLCGGERLYYGLCQLHTHTLLSRSVIILDITWILYFWQRSSQHNTVEVDISKQTLSQADSSTAHKTFFFLNSHTSSAFLHSREWPASVTDTFFASRGCPLSRTSTVLRIRCWINTSAWNHQPLNIVTKFLDARWNMIHSSRLTSQRIIAQVKTFKLSLISLKTGWLFL